MEKTFEHFIQLQPYLSSEELADILLVYSNKKPGAHVYGFKTKNITPITSFCKKYGLLYSVCNNGPWEKSPCIQISKEQKVIDELTRLLNIDSDEQGNWPDTEFGRLLGYPETASLFFPKRNGLESKYISPVNPDSLPFGYWFVFSPKKITEAGELSDVNKAEIKLTNEWNTFCLSSGLFNANGTYKTHY